MYGPELVLIGCLLLIALCLLYLEYASRRRPPPAAQHYHVHLHAAPPTPHLAGRAQLPGPTVTQRGVLRVGDRPTPETAALFSPIAVRTPVGDGLTLVEYTDPRPGAQDDGDGW
jgi:hypothetical protein